ncbi:hypothetical protein JHK86_022202 [Glycine max]|nr:hypothetical protein JHK86_022202 [Glycine max]
MAVLVVEHNFLDAYAGESRDGSLAVKFSTGDIISMNSVVTTTKDLNDLCYAVLAIFRSRFPKTEGITSGLCMKGQCLPRVCVYLTSFAQWIATLAVVGAFALNVTNSILSCGNNIAANESKVQRFATNLDEDSDDDEDSLDEEEDIDD